MYHNEIKRIIEKILKGEVDKYVLMEYLTNNFDCEKIYDSDVSYRITCNNGNQRTLINP